MQREIRLNKIDFAKAVKPLEEWMRAEMAEQLKGAPCQCDCCAKRRSAAYAISMLSYVQVPPSE